MKKDVTELKKMFLEILQNPNTAHAAAAFTRESLMHDENNGDHSAAHAAIIVAAAGWSITSRLFITTIFTSTKKWKSR